MRPAEKAALLLLLGLCASPAFAWWAVGHQVVAEVAFRNIKQSSADRIAELIKVFTDEYPTFTSISDLATWPDDIKEHGVGVYDAWHFIDIPIAPDPSYAPNCPPQSQNVVWSTNSALSILKSARATKFEKATFLNFLIHFVGDSHQPLHCSTLYSADFPDGDRGGNKFILPSGNLHALWDGGFGLFVGQARHPTDESTKERLAKIADDVTAMYPPSSLAAELAVKDAMEWARGSAGVGEWARAALPEGRRPSGAYLNASLSAVRRQAALAGYRLAAALDEAFAAEALAVAADAAARALLRPWPEAAGSEAGRRARAFAVGRGLSVAAFFTLLAGLASFRFLLRRRRARARRRPARRRPPRTRGRPPPRTSWRPLAEPAGAPATGAGAAAAAAAQAQDEGGGGGGGAAAEQ
eukprot:tig00000367_g24476.t1